MQLEPRPRWPPTRNTKQSKYHEFLTGYTSSKNTILSEQG